MKPKLFQTGLMLWLATTLIACNTQPSTPTAQAADNAASTVISPPATSALTANGVLLPARRQQLSFGAAGFVKSINAEVGQTVQAGQVLAELDAVESKRAVAQAQLDLEEAQARLEQLQAQAMPAPEQVLAATAAITSAQMALAQTQAQSRLRGNQDILDRAALTQAELALKDAQSAYDQVLRDPITKNWAPYSPAAKALADMQEHYRLTLAEYQLHSADRGYAAAIAAAEAQLAQARLTLYEVQHPTTPEALKLAQLAVERAEQTLAIAQERYAGATLRAPFDGVVATVGISAGEWSASGTPIVELLDVSRWRIETKNVGELQIARIREGQSVAARVNAFRDEPLRGHVLTISPVAVVQQGDTTYTLIIELEPVQLNLRPGMTVQIEIEEQP